MSQYKGVSGMSCWISLAFFYWIIPAAAKRGSASWCKVYHINLVRIICRVFCQASNACLAVFCRIQVGIWQELCINSGKCQFSLDHMQPTKNPSSDRAVTAVCIEMLFYHHSSLRTEMLHCCLETQTPVFSQLRTVVSKKTQAASVCKLRVHPGALSKK